MKSPHSNRAVISLTMYDVLSKLKGRIKSSDSIGNFYVNIAGWGFSEGTQTKVAIDVLVENNEPFEFTIFNGKIMYSTYNDGLLTSDMEKKYEMKISKFISNYMDKFIHIDVKIGSASKLKDRAIEVVIESLKASLEPLEALVSQDVEGVYRTPTAYENTGTLGNSCMRPEQRDKYRGTQFLHNYNKIDGLKIAYLLDKEGRLTTRALLWHDVEVKDGRSINYMDRIYGTELSIVRMKEWANNNGYWSKVQQTYSDPTLEITKDGKHFTIKEFKKDIKLTASELQGVPYFDTLRFLKDTEISSYIATGVSNDKYNNLQVTHGEIRTKQCKHCGRLIFPNEVLRQEDHEGDHCGNCLLMSYYLKRYFLKEEVTQVTINCDWDYLPHNYDMSELLHSDVDNTWLSKKQAVTDVTGEIIAKKNSCIPYGKEVRYHVSNCVFSRFLRTYILQSEVKSCFINEYEDVLPRGVTEFEGLTLTPRTKYGKPLYETNGKIPPKPKKKLEEIPRPSDLIMSDFHIGADGYATANAHTYTGTMPSWAAVGNTVTFN